MCRLLVYCSRDAASVAELLGTESFRAFTSLSDLHGDGWGMAWYAGSRPAAWKSAARAGREPVYDKTPWQPLGDLGLVHLRWATPGLAVSDVNTHPFRYGDYTFAHNGAIYPQGRLGAMLPAALGRGAAGSQPHRGAVFPPFEVAGGGARRRKGRGDRRHDSRHIAAVHGQQPERDLAGARRAVRDLVPRPVHGPRRLAAGTGAWRAPGRGRRLLRPGLPGHRRRRSRGQLGLAHARLDAATLGSRAGHQPAHAGHVRPADRGLVTEGTLSAPRGRR